MEEKKEKQYVSDNARLMEEWDWEKNEELGFDPHELTCGSGKKVWWKCSKEHEWEATLASRKAGHGCPYCSGRLAIIGETDLQTLRPDIAKYWHPTKNGKKTPSNVTVSSGVKYWWLGTCGHEWETKVSTMCDKNTLSICPICSSQNRTSFPEQAIFYYLHKLFPDCISRYDAHKKELDIFIPSLSVGIEYDGLRYHTQKTKEKEKKKDDFFFSKGIQVFHIREQEDNLTKICGNSVMYRPWNKYKHLNEAIKCLFDLISDYLNIPTISTDIDIERDNTEILTQYMKKRLENGFAAKHPEILAEWHPTKNGNLDPWLIAEKSNQKFWWICKNGHEWSASVNERTGHKTGCPYCAGNILLVGENDLETIADISLLKEWDYEKNNGLKPSDITAKTNKKVWWKCKYGHEWRASVNARLKGTSCPYCYGRLAIEGQTDLLTTHPNLANEWHYEKNSILPQNVKSGSNVKVWWRGKCGHEWEMKVSERSKGAGCPYCAGKKVQIGFNDLESLNPTLALEWCFEKNNGLTPKDVTSGSSKIVWWKCSNGHQWKASVASRSNGNGCPYCNRRIAWKGETDVSTTNPEIASFWDFEKNKDIDIFSCIAGSEKVVWWKCEKGHSWQNMIRRQVANNKCPICFPDKETTIRIWRKNNPNGTKTQCSKETGISRPTVSKWWE